MIVPSEVDFSRVLQLLRRVPLPPEGEVVQGADDAQVAAIAERYGQPLPSSYVEWLRVCNGSSAGPGGIFGARVQANRPDALDILDFHPEWIDFGWIPVAGDGCGNYYVLDFSRRYIDRDAVFFVDSMDGEGLTYVAASCLPIFLESLLERELGERSWPFSAAYVKDKDPDIMLIRDAILLPWYG
ncbi:SMI1/KNR4 family protein [Catellatospora coxensis]|uniref:Knr4/Smi1-like domain-containing protein n=1 Tax=Catellatospora coxensis TaxID=310354 RepID=A0A8J3PAI1_9ACTN|nr:SMI1/KNR4 family protein [Catellatospora coxensis]GIG09589.1 hypothetical protein Cco03nite_62890 [Catellatospora coxensis]